MNGIDKILILTGIGLLIGIVYFGYGLTEITGEVVFSEEPYEHYTTAICDNFFCQDYKVYCDNGKVVEIVKIEGASIYHDEDWVDYRTEKEKTLCYGK